MTDKSQILPDMLSIGTPVIINWPSIKISGAHGVITRRRDVLVGENYVAVKLDDATPCVQKFPFYEPQPYVLPPGTVLFVEVGCVTATQERREIDGVIVIGPPS